MRSAKLAPVTVIAALGLAFTSACGDEKTVGDAAAATAPRHEPFAGHTGPRNGTTAVDARAISVPAGRTGVTLYRFRDGGVVPEPRRAAVVVT